MKPRAAALLVAGFVLAAPATAGAVTATVSNDNGADVTLGSPFTLRQMTPKTVKLNFAPGEQRYSLLVTAPDGSVAAQQPCQAMAAYAPLPLKFHGSGRYTVAFAVSASANDLSCTAATQNTGQFNWDPKTSVRNTEKLVLTRKPGSPSTLRHVLSVTPNPGSDRTEIRYARGVRPAADGGLPGPTLGGTIPATDRSQPVGFNRPGRWAIVSRPVSAEGFVGAWSSPEYVNVKAPFDLVSVDFADRKGPSYKVKGDVGAAVPRKTKIEISVADGRRGGKFAIVRTVRTGKHGRFVAKFSYKRPGRFRVRYRFAGNHLVAPGRVTQLVNVRRITA